MNRLKAKQMAFFACYINDIEIIDEVDQVDREAIDRDISPVARFKKDQWNCSDDFMKRNQCKKDALLDWKLTSQKVDRVHDDGRCN